MREVLFDVMVFLCKMFPALEPFGLRRMPAYRIFDTARRIIGHNSRMEKLTQKNRRERVIRRPAGDDWF